MKARYALLLGTILLLSLVLPACGGKPAAPATNPPQPAPTQTVPPPPPQPTDTATQPPVVPTATTAPAPTQAQHLVKPGSPSYIVEQTIGDCIEGEKYDPNKPITVPAPCNLLETGLIERPFTQDMNSYFPYLDIVRTQFGATHDWYFVRVVVFNDSAPAGNGDVYYIVKLDLAADGRNSNVVLFSIKNLPMTATAWTTDGIQAWTDVEGTVTPIYGAGISSDPDLIWVRRSPKSIEFAFKPALINTNRFAWWSWAYQGTQTPPDLALVLSTPDIYQLDNTCALGFNMAGTSLVNQCIK